MPAGTQRAAAVVLLVLWLAQVACSGGMITPAELTATALAPTEAVLATAISAATQAAVTPTPSTTAVTVVVEAPLPTETLPPTEAPPPTATNTPVPPGTGANPQLVDPIATTPEVGPGNGTEEAPILYYTQAGDTLRALASRFNVKPEEITSPNRIPAEGLFDPGVLLLIPPRLGEVSSSKHLIPDSEIVYSPSALELDLKAFVEQSAGYLSTYKEWRSNGWYDGPGVIQRVAIENSVNPRLLLTILEYQAHWVYNQPATQAETEFPIGWLNLENEKKGLYYQLSWAVQQLNIGYYGWRDGTVTELTFRSGEKLRLAPDLNAGTVALLYMYSRLYDEPQWAVILYGDDGLVTLYEQMFGDPWMRARSVEPLFPATLTQPPMELPFASGRTWSLTGGPHSAWLQGKLSEGGARAALDFAPQTVEHGCYKATEKTTAVASGLVVRSENGVVVLDLDGDGYEQTGWSVLYLHIAAEERIPLGTWVALGDPIGFPSCEGGVATGTHIHLARKYNGEWILADGPMPFVLSGWRAYAYPEAYMGYMTNGNQTIYSSLYGEHGSLVTRIQ